MQKNPIPESGNNTDSQGWDLIIYKVVILHKRKNMEIKQKGINNECKSYNKIGLSRSGRDPRRRHLLYGIHNHALYAGL